MVAMKITSLAISYEIVAYLEARSRPISADWPQGRDHLNMSTNISCRS
jgi:hypothetical protein